MTVSTAEEAAAIPAFTPSAWSAGAGRFIKLGLQHDAAAHCRCTLKTSLPITNASFFPASAEV